MHIPLGALHLNTLENKSLPKKVARIHPPSIGNCCLTPLLWFSNGTSFLFKI